MPLPPPSASNQHHQLTPPPDPAEEDADITPFTSETLKTEEKLDFSWKSFRHPKLARCPFAIEDLTFQAYLGGGLDGVVFKAQYEDKTVALKIFRDEKRPKPIPMYNLYWAFERECMNNPLLEKMAIRLRESRRTNQPIYIYPDPKTHQEALYNQRAFADEGRVDEAHPPRRGMEPLTLDDDEELHVNPCYGWMQIPAEKVHRLLDWRKRPEIAYFAESDHYYGIVYEYIGHGGGSTINIDRVVRQMRIFHLAGFQLVAFNYNNWRGDAVLIDLSDIISPAHSFGWFSKVYQKQRDRYEEWTRGSFAHYVASKYNEFSWDYPNEEDLTNWARRCTTSTFKLE